MKKMVDELTGLRGIAAGCILLNHILLIFPILKKTIWASCFGWFGTIGMDLFFILSGFVICYNYADKIRASAQNGIFAFLAARIARLYPLYLAFILFFFIFNLCKFGWNNQFTAHNITSLPIFLAGMQSWFYSFIGNMPVIYMQGSANISWSISTEFALYICFIPLVWTLLRINTPKAYMVTLAFLLLIQWSWLYCCSHLNLPSSILNSIFGLHSSYTTTEWLTFHSPLARLWEFLCGCLIARSYTPTFTKLVQSTCSCLSPIVSIILAAGLIVSLWHPFPTRMFIIFALVTYTFSIVHAGNSLLKSKLFIYLGEISYSTYLLHIIFVQFLEYHGKHTIPYIINIPIFIILTYITAHFVYKYYEMPMRQFVRKFLLSQ